MFSLWINCICFIGKIAKYQLGNQGLIYIRHRMGNICFVRQYWAVIAHPLCTDSSFCQKSSTSLISPSTTLLISPFKTIPLILWIRNVSLNKTSGPLHKQFSFSFLGPRGPLVLPLMQTGFYIVHTTQLLLLGKFEYTGGPIFKVVLEC